MGLKESNQTLDQDQDQKVGPDLGPSCLQMLPADTKSRRLEARKELSGKY